MPDFFTTLSAGTLVSFGKQRAQLCQQSGDVSLGRPALFAWYHREKLDQMNEGSLEALNNSIGQGVAMRRGDAGDMAEK